MTMGEKILNMRKARGWNQEELADRVGVTRQAVSRWESGSAKPDADKIIAICDLFGVSADYLLRDQYAAEGEPQQQEQKAEAAAAKVGYPITLKQWLACGCLVAGGVVALVLKIIYVMKDTNYTVYSQSGRIIKGFSAFLQLEELGFLWFLAWAMMICGLIYLVCWPIILKNKDSIGWLFGAD